MKQVRSASGVGPSFGGLSYSFCVIRHCMSEEQLKGWNPHGVIIISVNFFISQDSHLLSGEVGLNWASAQELVCTNVATPSPASPLGTQGRLVQTLA